MSIGDRDVIRPRNRAAWRSWLQHHHADSPGVWIEYPKAHSDFDGPTYNDLVEEALCFGWIDSVVRKVAEPGLKCLHMTPRKPGSIWAKTNKERVRRLHRAGLMTSAGLAVISAAKRDGSWFLLDDVEAHVIADDLAAAFAIHRHSRERFEALPTSQQEQVLYWCYSAKRPTTRAARIAATAEAAAQGRSPLPQ